MSCLSLRTSFSSIFSALTINLSYSSLESRVCHSCRLSLSGSRLTCSIVTTHHALDLLPVISCFTQDKFILSGMSQEWDTTVRKQFDMSFPTLYTSRITDPTSTSILRIYIIVSCSKYILFYRAITCEKICPVSSAWNSSAFVNQGTDDRLVQVQRLGFTSRLAMTCRKPTTVCPLSII